MAIVGSAHVVIRALTDKLQADIQAGLNRAAANASSSGSSAGQAWNDGFASKINLPEIGKKNFGKVENDAKRSSAATGAIISAGIAGGMTAGAAKGSQAVVAASGRAGGAAGSIFGRMFNSSSGGPSRMFISMALRIAALIPLLGALGGAISAVVSGLFAMVGAAGKAVWALSPLPGLIAALVQGGGVMLTAFSGIGDALGAGLEAANVPAQKAAKAMDGLKTSARDAAEAIRDAAEAVRDAREGIRDAAEGISDAHEGVRDAVKALKDTEEAAAEMIVNAQEAIIAAKKRRRQLAKEAAEAEEQAAENVVDAEKNLVKSHDRVRKAQDALTDARKRAEERLIDLQFATRGGAIAEQRAIMALQDARYRLAATSELPADNRLRQEAQLAFDEAQLNLEMTKERNGDTAEELQEIREQGVDGTDEVVSAQERLLDAQEDVLDATEAVSDAMKAQRQLTKDIAEAQKEATQAVKDAKGALRDAYEDAPEMISDAKEALSDAKEALSDSKEAMRDAQESLRDALRALSDAKKGSADANAAFAAGIPEVNKYQEALSKLSPPAQRFVQFLISIRDEMKSLRDAAQAGLFPGLQTAIENLVYGPLFPALREAMYTTGVAVANAAISISESLSTGVFVGNFSAVAEGNNRTIERMGLVVGDLTAALFAFMVAAQPITDELTAWIVKWAEAKRVQTEAGNANGELTAKLVAGAEMMKQIGRIISNLWEGFKELGQVASVAGQSLWDSFEAATQRFADFTDNKDNVKQLRKDFDQIADNVRALGDLFLVMGGALFRLGADPTIAKLSKQLEGTVLILEGLVIELLDRVGPLLVELVDKILIAFEEISKSDAISIFLETMSTALDILISAFQNPVFGPVLRTLVKIGAAMYAISIISKFPGLSQLAKILMFIGKTVLPIVGKAMWAALGPWGLLIVGIVAGLVVAYKKFEWFRNIVNQIGEGLKLTFEVIVDAAKWLWDVLFGNSIFPDIANAFVAFKDTVAGIFDSIANFFTTTIPNAATALFDWLGKHWPTILAILTGPIGLAVLAISNNWDKITAAFSAAKNWVLGAFNTAWESVRSTLLNPIIGAKDTIDRLFGQNGPIRSFFNGIKNWVTGAFSNLWSGIEAVFINPISSAKDTISRWFGADGPIRGFFSGIWNWFDNTFRSTWDKLEDFIVNPIETAKDTIKGFLGEDGPIRKAFREGKGAIEDIWVGMQRIVASPVNFIINKVYNNGLRKALNLLPGVNLEEASEIEIPETAKASGGVLPGWSPGKDIHHFFSPTAGKLHLSGGEAIMRPEFTRAVGGPQGVERLNSLARRKKLKMPDHGGYFLGGTLPLFGANSIKAHPLPYYGASWAGDLNSPYDLSTPPAAIKAWKSGKVAQAYDWKTSYGKHVVINHDGISSLYAHMSTILTAVGKTVAAGEMIGRVGETGNAYGAHLHFETRGGNVPTLDTGDVGGGKPVNPGLEKKESWLERIRNIPKYFTETLSSIKKMYNMEGYGKEFANASKEIGSDMVQWVNDKIPDKIEVNNFPDLNLPDNPIPDPFDRGGIASGKDRWIPKQTARPERVLSPAQTEAFERLVTWLEKNGDRAGGGGGFRDVNLDVHVPQDASARDVVEGIVYEMRRLSRGGRYNG